MNTMELMPTIPELPSNSLADYHIDPLLFQINHTKPGWIQQLATTLRIKDTLNTQIIITTTRPIIPIITITTPTTTLNHIIKEILEQHQGPLKSEITMSHILDNWKEYAKLKRITHNDTLDNLTTILTTRTLDWKTLDWRTQ